VSALRSFGSARGVLRRSFSPIDVALLIAVVGVLYAILRVGGLTVSFTPSQLHHVSTDPAKLPYYAARSLLRMFIALFFSVLFSLTYGYVAARNRRAEKVLVPLLDIMQSVPVLGFLTVAVAAFIPSSPATCWGWSAPRSSPSSPPRRGT
jgi:NitT/TauT family transport system permease protein